MKYDYETWRLKLARNCQMTADMVKLVQEVTELRKFSQKRGPTARDAERLNA